MASLSYALFVSEKSCTLTDRIKRDQNGEGPLLYQLTVTHQQYLMMYGSNRQTHDGTGYLNVNGQLHASCLLILLCFCIIFFSEKLLYAIRLASNSIQNRPKCILCPVVNLDMPLSGLLINILAILTLKIFHQSYAAVPMHMIFILPVNSKKFSRYELHPLTAYGISLYFF